MKKVLGSGSVLVSSARLFFRCVFVFVSILCAATICDHCAPFCSHYHDAVCGFSVRVLRCFCAKAANRGLGRFCSICVCVCFEFLGRDHLRPFCGHSAAIIMMLFVVCRSFFTLLLCCGQCATIVRPFSVHSVVWK